MELRKYENKDKMLVTKYANKYTLKKIISEPVTSNMLVHRVHHPELSIIKEWESEDYVIKALYVIVHDACQLISSEQKFNEIQIKHLVSIISDQFDYLNLNEIKYALSNGSVGVYGKIYGALGLDDICEWIKQYVKIDRPQIFEKYDELRKAKIEEEKKKRAESYPAPDIERLKKLNEKIEKAQKERLLNKIIERESQPKPKFSDFIDLCNKLDIDMASYNSYIHRVLLKSPPLSEVVQQSICLIQLMIVQEYNKSHEG
jgi:hypothetical protein